jgi:hypothetical protein
MTDMANPYDPAAVRILFDTYWSSGGWKSEPITSAEDLAYAKSKGVMFDPCPFDHDETVDAVIKLAASIPTRRIAQAFLYSFTTRELVYRSALGSFAMASWMPLHTFVGNRTCDICRDYSWSSKNEDYNVLNFERLKWGGVRHMSPMYQLFDLQEFLKLPKVVAKSEDIRSLLKKSFNHGFHGLHG